MDISKIMNELADKSLILGDNLKCKPLTGGTVSEIYLLSFENESDLVIKSNEPDIVKSEAEFLTFYQDIPLLPELIYTDPTNEYILYTYISGATVNVSTHNKQEILQAIVVGLLNNYKTISSTEGWGWRDSPTDSWGNFLLTEVKGASEVLTNHLLNADVEFVMTLIMRAGKYESLGDPFLIHGDCGIHNFIMEDGRLSGVIDPAPVSGPPLYDLIYAFCSSPTDLTKETLDSAASLLMVQPIDKKWLYEEVAIVLYLRLATCLKHHPADFASYLAAWNYWKYFILSDIQGLHCS